MSDPAGSLESMYHLLLRAYPSEYIETFGDEMQGTFVEGLKEARSQGVPGLFILREIRDIPRSLFNAYWYGWKSKLLDGIQTIQTVMSSTDLPPTQPDGRDSRLQVLWEMILFLLTGSALLMATYFHIDSLPPGWQRNFTFLGKILVPLTAPVLLWGLARGSPRWSYPFGGLLLGYYGIFAGQISFWLFLFLMLSGALILAIAAILTDPQPALLPVFIRRIGQSLSEDWTRLSFGIYGAAPLLIMMAFDDSHVNNQTTYFALSILAMTAGALVYCRSRAVSIQIGALLLGITLATWGALLDKITFANGLINWIVVSSQGSTGTLWIFNLWIQWAILIMLPGLFISFGRVSHMKRAI